MCTKKGLLHLIVPKGDFELSQGAGALATYRFFCKVCGIHSFYVPRSHPDGFSVNARCLDDAAPAWFEVEPFDGQHWEESVHRLR
jgi:hypothetical protein